MAHGKFHWNELMTRDAETAKAFFGDTLGWTYEKFAGGEHDYWVAMTGEEPAGGIMPVGGMEGMDGLADRWTAYIEVDDIDKRLAAVADAGGRILREPFDVPMVGRIALVADPTGAVVGWITPAPREG